MKRALYENANAPRLERKETETPDDERTEISEMLKKATSSLTNADLGETL